MEKTMNPTFRHIDWLTCGPGVTRRQELTLRVWVRGAKHGSWQQLLQMKLELSGPRYLGKSVSIRHSRRVSTLTSAARRP